MLQASIDTSHVQTSFDKRGLPVFKSDLHRLNWFLNVSKCEHLVLENTLEHDVEVTIQLKVFDSNAIIEGFEKAYHESVNDDGTLLFNPSLAPKESFFERIKCFIWEEFRKLFKKKIKKQTKRNHKFWQKKIIIKPNESYTFQGDSLITVRSVCTNADVSFTYNNRKVLGKFGKNSSSEMVQKNMNQLLAEEFLDAGKKSFESNSEYDFFDWNALGISENLFGRHRDFLLCFYKEANLSLNYVSQKRLRIIEKSKKILQEALQNTVLPEQPLIPLIMHKLWITSNDTPNEIPKDRLEHYVKEVRKLKEFRHIVWVIDAKKIPKNCLSQK